MEAKLTGWEHRALDATRLRLVLEDEIEAAQWFEAARWQGTPRCPRCDSTTPYLVGTRGPTRTAKDQRRREWRCRACEYVFTVRRGTFLEGSRCCLAAWATALYMALHGDSFADELAAATGVQRRTALRLEDTATSVVRQVREVTAAQAAAVAEPETEAPDVAPVEEPVPDLPWWWDLRRRSVGGMLVLVAATVAAWVGSELMTPPVLRDRWVSADGDSHMLETRRLPEEPVESWRERHQARAAKLRELFPVE